MNRKRWMRTDTAFLCALALMAGVLLYRVSAGLPSSDEAFYLTVPLRLAQGDSLLVDEWHVTQLSGFILYPLVQLYLWAAGGTEGIVLAFRFVYLAAQLMMTVAGWLLLRRKNPWGSMAACVIFGLFVPFGIMALSYNSIGLMTVWLIALLEISETGEGRFGRAAEGFLLALAVLCNPYMLLLYAVWAVRALAVLRRDRGRKLKQFAWTTLGAGVVLAAFAGMLFTRTSVGEIAANLPYVLSDASHQSKGVYDFLRPVIVFCQFYPIYTVLTVLLLAAGMFLRKWRPRIFVCMALVAVAAAWRFCLKETPYVGVNYGAVLVPMVPLGLAAFLFSEKKNFRLLDAWLIGVLYAVCMILSSNVGLSSMQNALTVPASVSALMIAGWLGERDGRPMKVCCAAVTAVWAAALVLSAVCGIFNDGKPWQLTETVAEGPYRGTRTTAEKKDAFDAEYGNILAMGDCAGKNLVFYSVCPYGYLIHSDANNAALSAWLDGPIRAPDDPNMAAYYGLHPERCPDMIYVDSGSSGIWTEEQWQAYGVDNGYELSRFDNGALLLSRK